VFIRGFIAGTRTKLLTWLAREESTEALLEGGGVARGVEDKEESDMDSAGGTGRRDDDEGRRSLGWKEEEDGVAEIWDGGAPLGTLAAHAAMPLVHLVKLLVS